MIEARGSGNHVVRLTDGEPLLSRMEGLDMEAAVIVSGIGMVRETTLGYWNGSSYDEHVVSAPCELVSMQGTLGRRGDDPVVHAHIAIARADGTVLGGHLLGATVANTAEIVMRPLPDLRLSRRLEPNGTLGLYPEEGGSSNRATP